jgi:hypothetical protein
MICHGPQQAYAPTSVLAFSQTGLPVMCVTLTIDMAQPYSRPNLRLQASRMFQMRLGKFYLLAHTNLVRPDPDSCPRCDEDLETVDHALLECLARQHARDRFPPNLTLAEAWSSPKLLNILGEYITRARTGCPPSPPPSPLLTSPASQALFSL